VVRAALRCAGLLRCIGDADSGCWRIAPVGDALALRRRYVDGTLIPETEFGTEPGTVRITNIVRIVDGLRGTVAMAMELVIRFDYGRNVPWVHRVDGATVATAGPDTIELRTPIATRGEQLRTVAQFSVTAGERVPFVLNHCASHERAAGPLADRHALRKARRDWRAWSRRSRYEGR